MSRWYPPSQNDQPSEFRAITGVRAMLLTITNTVCKGSHQNLCLQIQEWHLNWANSIQYDIYLVQTALSPLQNNQKLPNEYVSSVKFNDESESAIAVLI